MFYHKGWWKQIGASDDYEEISQKGNAVEPEIEWMIVEVKVTQKMVESKKTNTL